MRPQSRKIISEVVSIPTAPFHEHGVISYITRFCLKNHLKLFQDAFGNIIIRYKRGGAEQPVVLTAHMDHPGFQVLETSGKTAVVGLLGGVDPKLFKKARVVIATKSGLVKGKVVRELKKKWMGKPVFEVTILQTAGLSSPRRRGSPEPKDFGYYDLVPVKFTKNIIYTKSADNLMSAALLLDLLKTLKQKRAAADVTVVMTRAEEVGFVGAIALAHSKLLKKNVPVIVLETSNAKPAHVAINAGPVIRVGDRQSGFTPEVDAWLSMVAETAAKKNMRFKYQRALMSGGRCEASAYVLKDYTVGGIVFPLGNYHNNGERAYAPEFVGVEDYANFLEFLLALSNAPKIKTAFAKKKNELWKNYKLWEKML